MARTCLASYMGPGDLNSGPHAYTAGTLTHWTASSALQLFTLIPGPVDNIGVLQPFPLNWDTLCRKEEGHSRDSGSKHASHVWGRGNLRDSQAPLLKVVKQQTPQDYGKSKKKKKSPKKLLGLETPRGSCLEEASELSSCLKVVYMVPETQILWVIIHARQGFSVTQQPLSHPCK